jgi:metal-dependent amidase/aminoacylase/carboxypeptidase family protein
MVRICHDILETKQRKPDAGASSVIYNTTFLKNKGHGIIAATREVYNATRRLGDGSRLILRQRVRGSARAVRAVRNTEVLQTETRVVADVPATSNHLSAWHSRFEIRELNLQTLAQRQENSAAAYKVPPSGADLAAPLSPQLYAKPEFMGPLTRHDGQHADAMIKDFTALLDNTQDATHCVGISSGTQEIIEHMSHSKMYILDEQLYAMELCISHGIKVQVEGLEGERISQMCRCTGSQSGWEGDRWNDWVWVKQCPGRFDGVLNGCLPWQLQQLFKIKLQNDD